MQTPPLLPEIVLARVVRLARFDGLSVFALGSVFALMMVVTREVPFAAVGLLAAGAGAVELHGVSLLKQGEARGMQWLIASQPFLLIVILGYCALRMTHFEMPPLPDGFRELAQAAAQQWGMSVDDYFRTVNRLTVQALAVVAFAYQGAMAVYYLRRRASVARALAATPDSDFVT